ncbi:hypothetical protein B0H14DRAFT_2747720 [Mycena olivaceomarginata]|nr:hypothetical protein B0H14DRAFT_2747720 [Mycena olivaceomarginata]
MGAQPSPLLHPCSTLAPPSQPSSPIQHTTPHVYPDLQSPVNITAGSVCNVFLPGQNTPARTTARPFRTLFTSYLSPSPTLVDTPSAIRPVAYNKPHHYSSPAKSAMKLGGNQNEQSSPTKSRVRFNPPLEPLVLYAEQKLPAACHTLSPTDDTGTKGDLQVALPSALPLSIEGNVKIEGLAVSPDGTSVIGAAAVAKMAFGKWAEVWLSFDNWQTRSQIRTRYGPGVGVFTFSMRPNDFPRSKVVMLALEYNDDVVKYRVTFRQTEGI